MKKRTLCINIPHSSRLSQAYAKLKHIYFPIGLAHIILSIKSNCPGYGVDILDLNFCSFDEVFFRDYISRIYEKDAPPYYVMFGAMSTNYRQVKSVSDIVRKVLPNARVVCGGTIADIHSRYLLEKGIADICVLGEGEETVSELLNNPDVLFSVKGIAFLDERKEYRRTPCRKRIKRIDSVTSIYPLFDIKSYINSFWQTTGYKGMYISASRGCYFSCKFCYRPIDIFKENPGEVRKVIHRSIEAVIDEIKWLVKNYNINAFNLIDELPCADKKWMQDFCVSLLKNRIKLKWACQARIDQFSEKDNELLRLMKKSGLVRIGFGLESGSRTVLKGMGKEGYVPERANMVIRLVRRSGIKPVVSVMMGYPGETEDTLAETIEFLQKNLLSMDSFFMLQPFPGTEVYRTHVRGLINEEEWLERYSHKGDASRLIINLTDMSDDVLECRIHEAKKKVKNRVYRNYLSYYSLFELPMQVSNDLYLFLRKRLKGVKYETV
ncbi:B12-binding domain-containing radical SAM protein [Candidatus Omnitrophota bacterium]